MVSKIMKELYNNTPSGLCGNEDCGQMSAWYVLSAIGFHPVNPANGEYQLGYPLFNKVEIPVAGGKAFVVEKNNNEGSAWKLNGGTIKGTAIRHQDILDGGKLVFH